LGENIKMKYLKYLTATLLILILVAVGLFQLSKSRNYQVFGELIPRVETEKKIVALTFDDGPTKENTDKVLQILKEVDAKATFYLIGGDLEKNLAEGKKIAAAGHEIGNHTYSHQRMVLKSPSFIENEIEKTNKLIRATGYQGEINFRPPYSKKLIGLPYYLGKHNIKTIMCDVEPETYLEPTAKAEEMVKYVEKNTKSGSIILLHVMYESREESVKAIKGVVTSLRSKGYEFVTVSELLKENSK
jgi:peptidoglycan-N-acetylglucosamine deacetylase